LGKATRALQEAVNGLAEEATPAEIEKLRSEAKPASVTKAGIEAMAVPPGKFDTYLWDSTLPSFRVRS
jgi:hypothetical protein